MGQSTSLENHSLQGEDIRPVMYADEGNKLVDLNLGDQSFQGNNQNIIISYKKQRFQNSIILVYIEQGNTVIKYNIFGEWSRNTLFYYYFLGNLNVLLRWSTYGMIKDAR